MDSIKTTTDPDEDSITSQPYDNIVLEAINARKQADDLKAAAIKKLLSMRGQIDTDLKRLGYNPSMIVPNENGEPQRVRSRFKSEPEIKRAAGPKPFRSMGLASIVRIILNEHGGGPMHGKEIEKIVKAGGYTKGGKHWQGYMSIALKRAGGFENIGQNRWKLNDQIAPMPIGRKQI